MNDSALNCLRYQSYDREKKLLHPAVAMREFDSAVYRDAVLKRPPPFFQFPSPQVGNLFRYAIGRNSIQMCV